MFWLLSKLFWLIAQPPALIGLLVLAGLVLTHTRWLRFGRALIGLGLALLMVFGFTNTGELMLQPLEARYQRPASFPTDAAGLIVLGGGTVNDVSSARGLYELADSGDRFVEAARLALAHPDLKVLVTGGRGSLEGGGDSDAQGTARLFRAFGLDGPRFLYEDTSRNTHENAVNSAALLHPVDGQRYVLITSAFHMPRAVALFERAGFAVIPWPVDYRTKGEQSLALSPVYAIDNLDAFGTALREWIGLFAYWAAGSIPSPLP